MDPYYLLGAALDDEADMEELELLGELMGEDPILGQRTRLHTRIPAGRAGGAMSARARLAKALVSKTPGVPKPGGRELPLGFTPIQATNTSALAFNLTANPQVPIKGRRLVVDVVRSAAGSGGLITVTDIRVGQRSQMVSAQPLTVTTFGAGSFGVDMALDPAEPGIVITLSVAFSAQPGVGETVDVAATLIGLAIA